MKNLGLKITNLTLSILIASTSLVPTAAIADSFSSDPQQEYLQRDLRYFPGEDLRVDTGYVFGNEAQRSRLLEPFFLSFSFGRPSALWSGLVRERGETVQLASFPTNSHQTINHGLTENYLRILIHHDLRDTVCSRRGGTYDRRCQMSVAQYADAYFQSEMNPELSYSTWAYKINSASLCFGIDPIVFAGLLVKESKLKYSNEARRNSGTGYTQMTDDGIREVEHQMYPDLFRNVRYSYGRGIGWSITQARLSARNQVSNADCYWSMVKRTRGGYVTHDFNPENSAGTLRERRGYFRDVQDWLLEDVDRQIVYGAALFKAKLVVNYRSSATPYQHYVRTLRGYNGHASNRVDYSYSILREYPALLGINIDNMAPTYDRGVNMAFRRQTPSDVGQSSGSL